MTFWQIVFCIVINAIWVIPFLVEFIFYPLYDSIKDYKKRRKSIKANGYRLRCIECKYCRTKIYKPFYNSYTMAHFIPYYCRKFKIYLGMDSNVRCRFDDPNLTEYENTSNAKVVRDIFTGKIVNDDKINKERK